MIKATTIAWAAGVYEGEGSIGISGAKTKKQRLYRRSKGIGVFVILPQKPLWVLQELKKNFGGSIGEKRKKDGCRCWFLFGPSAKGFLMTIYSWLSPRRKRQIKRLGVFSRK